MPSPGLSQRRGIVALPGWDTGWFVMTKAQLQFPVSLRDGHPLPGEYTGWFVMTPVHLQNSPCPYVMDIRCRVSTRGGLL